MTISLEMLKISVPKLRLKIKRPKSQPHLSEELIKLIKINLPLIARISVQYRMYYELIPTEP